MNSEKRLAELDSVPIILTQEEYDLLAFLVKYAGELVTREALQIVVCGLSTESRTGTDTLDIHFKQLREKLGRYASQYIETAFGIGYRFQPCGKPVVALSA